MAYPAQGLYRTINTLSATGAQGEILKARKELAERMGGYDGHGREEDKVVRIFDEVVGRKVMYEGV